MQTMTREEAALVIREAFELVRTGRMTAKEYVRLFEWVTASTTAHPVRRAVLS